jgi:protein-L-isoaspartate(D-aspartate) O-methyltransferase
VSPFRPSLAIAGLLLAPAALGATSFAAQRAAMVERIRADVRAADPAADSPALRNALAAMAELPRERFMPAAKQADAYVDLPQDIGRGQTISDPQIVAVMTAALDLPPRAHLLDIGTGSGYQAALLSRLADRVSSVEIDRPLAHAAARRLRAMGYANVDVRTGDGFLGWATRAPFDGIVVAASAAAVPPALIEQLKPGGRLVIPIGATQTSTLLLRITKRADNTLDRCSLGETFFVPLTGPRAIPFARYGLSDRTIPLCFAAPIAWLL